MLFKTNILLQKLMKRIITANLVLKCSTQYIGAKIDKHGSIYYPSCSLGLRVYFNLLSGTVELEAANEHLHITSGKFSSKLLQWGKG